MHGMQSGWKCMLGAPRPVNAKALPPQPNMISGNIRKINVCFGIRTKDHISHSNVPEQRIA